MVISYRYRQIYHICKHQLLQKNVLVVVTSFFISISKNKSTSKEQGDFVHNV